MIYDKTYAPPKRRRSVLRFPLSRLRAGDGVRDVYLIHMRQDETGLVCAEGLAPLEKPFTEEPLRLFACADDLLSYNRVTSARANGIYAVFNKKSFYFSPLSSIRSAFSVTLKADELTEGAWCVVSDEKAVVYRLPSGAYNYSQNIGGVCGLEYAGRMFLVREHEIVYTGVYHIGNWNIETNTDAAKTGRMTVPEYCGKFIGATVYRDTAYFFAQYGVLKWKMGGNVLETEVVPYPIRCGEILPDTCRVAGDRIYFFTTRGLCRFDGDRFEQVEAPCTSQIDFANTAEASAFDGRYFANVTLKDGDRRVYVYDPRYERESFLNYDVTSFTALNKAYAIRNKELFEVTKKGLPPDGAPCSLCVRIALGGDQPCAEWVRVEGEGEFTVEASVKGDGCAFAKGSAGEVLPLSRVLRGAELALTVSSYEENFRLTGISIGKGEDERYED